MTDEMFQGMINKAREQRQQQLLAQQVLKKDVEQLSLVMSKSVHGFRPGPGCKLQF